MATRVGSSTERTQWWGIRNPSTTANGTTWQASCAAAQTVTRCLYVDGVDAGHNYFGASAANGQGLDIGGINGVFTRRFVGIIDNVVISRRGLSQDEVQAFLAMANLTWHPAVFTRSSGGETPAAEIAGTWSLRVPSNLENFYQLDLRGADSAGKQFRQSNLWRGSIDNRAPRIALEATATGITYLDPDGVKRLL